MVSEDAKLIIEELKGLKEDLKELVKSKEEATEPQTFAEHLRVCPECQKAIKEIVSEEEEETDEDFI